MSKIPQHRNLRNAFGQFATGITVVTARGHQQQPIGLTVNSFASVSLEPPLVSWCVDRSSARFHEFVEAEYYTISVLTAEQQYLSDLFAKRSWDDSVFDDVEWTEGHHQVPQLPNVCARFDCQIKHRYQGGDHVILVGAVLDYDVQPTAPLLFVQGEYKTLI